MGVGIAFYYLASADFEGIVPNAPGGMTGIDGEAQGFPNFVAALSANGYDLSDVAVSWGPMTLGGDVRGVDWDFVLDGVTNEEWRIYRGGEYRMTLPDLADPGVRHDVIVGPMPRLRMSIQYNDIDPVNAISCIDDAISGITEGSSPIDGTDAGTPQAIRNVADTILQDMGGDGVQFVFGSLQAALEVDFSATGRKGACGRLRHSRVA